MFLHNLSQFLTFPFYLEERGDIKIWWFIFTTCKYMYPFLDVIRYKEGTEIKIDIYHKPTDTFQYLHYYFCHPRHTKNNIPFNLARRVCTIVSDPVRNQQRLLELKDRLIQRKYPDTLVDSSIIKAEKKTPKERQIPATQ